MDDPILCECGCQAEVADDRRFLRGHNHRRPLSELDDLDREQYVTKRLPKPENGGSATARYMAYLAELDARVVPLPKRASARRSARRAS